MTRCFAFTWPLILAACTGEPAMDGSTANESASRTASSRTTNGLDLPSEAQAVRSAVWRWDEKNSMAVLGIHGGPPIFSVRCDTATKTLIFTRFAAAPQRGRATLSLTTRETVASLSASAVQVSPDGSSYWQATQTAAGLPKAVRRAFSAAGSLRISVGGTPPLEVAHSDLPLSAFRVCGSGNSVRRHSDSEGRAPAVISDGTAA
jgi:hypothetical protein